LNYLVSVKVRNQTINVKDQLCFNPLTPQPTDGTTGADIADTYGDCFISGFEEGGEFTALVCMKVKDKSKTMEIKAQAALKFEAGFGSIEGEAAFEMQKSDLSKETETTIFVNWSGGGQLKESSAPWDVETLMQVATRFPDLVA
jgi:hypothetical protein